MANNKIQLGDGTVLLDLTGDTVTPSKLKRGETAHDASGAPIVGIMDSGGGGGGTDHDFLVTATYNPTTLALSNISASAQDIAEAVGDDKDVRLVLTAGASDPVYYLPLVYYSYNATTHQHYIEFAETLPADDSEERKTIRVRKAFLSHTFVLSIEPEKFFIVAYSDDYGAILDVDISFIPEDILTGLSFYNIDTVNIVLVNGRGTHIYKLSNVDHVNESFVYSCVEQHENFDTDACRIEGSIECALYSDRADIPGYYYVIELENGLYLGLQYKISMTKTLPIYMEISLPGLTLDYVDIPIDLVKFALNSADFTPEQIYAAFYLDDANVTNGILRYDSFEADENTGMPSIILVGESNGIRARARIALYTSDEDIGFDEYALEYEIDDETVYVGVLLSYEFSENIVINVASEVTSDAQGTYIDVVNAQVPDLFLQKLILAANTDLSKVAINLSLRVPGAAGGSIFSIGNIYYTVPGSTPQAVMSFGGSFSLTDLSYSGAIFADVHIVSSEPESGYYIDLGDGFYAKFQIDMVSSQ